jgi:cysteine desulfurase/selenocysteine lyase
MPFPIEAVRAQFPSLATTDEGQRRIYFDNAAGTQVPQQTIDRIVDFFTASTATRACLIRPR